MLCMQNPAVAVSSGVLYILLYKSNDLKIHCRFFKLACGAASYCGLLEFMEFFSTISFLSFICYSNRQICIMKP